MTKSIIHIGYPKTATSWLQREFFPKVNNISIIPKKEIFKKNMKGKPVYLKDTGEKLGIVFDSIYDKDNHLIGYKIKDNNNL